MIDFYAPIWYQVGSSSLVCTHFLYRFLDGKKTTRSQFSVPGLREIHRNLKQEKNFNSRESFFRKSPFCTFSCINPGFGGPWDMFQKCHFGNFSFLPKWHFWTRAWNSKLFFAKSFFWGIMKVPFTKNIHNFFQGPSNSGFRSV